MGRSNLPGCVTRWSHRYVTIYAAQVDESDKNSKVWLSGLFELQEFLISFLILLLVEEGEAAMVYLRLRGEESTMER